MSDNKKVGFATHLTDFKYTKDFIDLQAGEKEKQEI
jgi:hypothetical protein